MKNDDINWNRNHHREMRQFTLEQESHFAQIFWQRFLMKIMFKVDFVKREVWTQRVNAYWLCTKGLWCRKETPNSSPLQCASNLTKLHIVRDLQWCSFIIPDLSFVNVFHLLVRYFLGSVVTFVHLNKNQINTSLSKKIKGIFPEF